MRSILLTLPQHGVSFKCPQLFISLCFSPSILLLALLLVALSLSLVSPSSLLNGNKEERYFQFFYNILKKDPTVYNVRR